MKHLCSPAEYWFCHLVWFVHFWQSKGHFPSLQKVTDDGKSSLSAKGSSLECDVSHFTSLPQFCHRSESCSSPKAQLWECSAHPGGNVTVEWPHTAAGSCTTLYSELWVMTVCWHICFLFNFLVVYYVSYDEYIWKYIFQYYGSGIVFIFDQNKIKK